jgi:hypothetical protein
MQKFDLPIVAANLSVNTALKAAIDARRSGVVLKTKSGGLRLVHYKDLAGASRSNMAIDKVDFVPILKVGRKKTVALQFDAVKTAGLKFGYRGATGDSANLLSVRETFAKRYISLSGGSRCSRPNKPANVPDRDWYHYYPPERRAAKTPNMCKLCGAKIS